jgi:hypothetical protein
MRFLIDGHNLLHALGKLSPGMSRRAFDEARVWLVNKARAAHGGDAIVVLDGHPAQIPRPDGPGVVYSRRETADDVIEDLIRADSDPRRLSVVSDDQRLRAAAKHRGGVSLRCLDYAERHLLAPPPPARRPEAPAPEKPEAGRMEEWADAFGGLDDDPRLGGP